MIFLAGMITLKRIDTSIHTFIIQGYFSYVLFLTNHTCHFIFKIAITPKVKNDCL